MQFTPLKALIKITFFHKTFQLLFLKVYTVILLIPREARAEGPSVARLINLSGRAEGPSGAKPREFERKIYLYICIYVYIVEGVRNVA